MPGPDEAPFNNLPPDTVFTVGRYVITRRTVAGFIIGLAAALLFIGWYEGFM